MKQAILRFMRPYVLQILKDHLNVSKTKNGMVSDVGVDDKPKPPPPDPFPPIVG